MCWRNVNALFRQRIHPIDPRFANREQQGVNPAFIHDAHLKSAIRRCNGNGQPFNWQAVYVTHSA